MDLDLVAN